MKFLEAKKLTAEGENKALGGPPENKSSARSVSRVSAPGAPAPTGPQASPQAKALAQEQGIDLTTITGTGAGGIITTGDVRQAIDARGQQG